MMPIPGASPYDNSYIIEYPDGDITLERRPAETYSDAKVHTVLPGETIQSISFQYYKDSGYWGAIADVNDILNPFEDLQPGLQIAIPTYG